MHKQVWIKVNAPVDEGAAELVAALNEFHAVETFESCQGDGSEPLWVCFRCGDGCWRRTTEFAIGHLAQHLYEAVGDGAVVAVRVTSMGATMADLSVRRPALRKTIKTIRRLARESNGDRNAEPMSENGRQASTTLTDGARRRCRELIRHSGVEANDAFIDAAIAAISEDIKREAISIYVDWMPEEFSWTDQEEELVLAIAALVKIHDSMA